MRNKLRKFAATKIGVSYEFREISFEFQLFKKQHIVRKKRS